MPQQPNLQYNNKKEKIKTCTVRRLRAPNEYIFVFFASNYVIIKC